MGFLDDLADAFIDPLNHPFEAAMIMAMLEEEEEDDEEFDDLYDEDLEDIETEDE